MQGSSYPCLPRGSVGLDHAVAVVVEVVSDPLHHTGMVEVAAVCLEGSITRAEGKTPRSRIVVAVATQEVCDQERGIPRSHARCCFTVPVPVIVPTVGSHVRIGTTIGAALTRIGLTTLIDQRIADAPPAVRYRTAVSIYRTPFEARFVVRHAQATDARIHRTGLSVRAGVRVVIDDHAHPIRGIADVVGAGVAVVRASDRRMHAGPTRTRIRRTQISVITVHLLVHGSASLLIAPVDRARILVICSHWRVSTPHDRITQVVRTLLTIVARERSTRDTSSLRIARLSPIAHVIVTAHQRCARTTDAVHAGLGAVAPITVITLSIRGTATRASGRTVADIDIRRITTRNGGTAILLLRRFTPFARITRKTRSAVADPHTPIGTADLGALGTVFHGRRIHLLVHTIHDRTARTTAHDRGVIHFSFLKGSISSIARGSRTIIEPRLDLHTTVRALLHTRRRLPDEAIVPVGTVLTSWTLWSRRTRRTLWPDLPISPGDRRTITTRHGVRTITITFGGTRRTILTIADPRRAVGASDRSTALLVLQTDFTSTTTLAVADREAGIERRRGVALDLHTEPRVTQGDLADTEVDHRRRLDADLTGSTTGVPVVFSDARTREPHEQGRNTHEDDAIILLS